jgi:hypothetical protein
MAIGPLALRGHAGRVPKVSEEELIRDVERRMIGKYPQLPPPEISTVVRKVRARFAQSRVRDFVPLLVKRRASDELCRRTEMLDIPA